MIFAIETEELTLRAFATQAEAVAACEALDVEAGTWLFWADDGTPLEPVFTVPNKRGLFVVQNGVYHLQPQGRLHHAPLQEAIDEVLNFETLPPIDSASGVKAYLSGAAERGSPAGEVGGAA